MKQGIGHAWTSHTQSTRRTDAHERTLRDMTERSRDRWSTREQCTQLAVGFLYAQLVDPEPQRRAVKGAVHAGAEGGSALRRSAPPWSAP